MESATAAKRRSLKKAAAFTLVEVVIAAALLAITLASLLTAVSCCFRYVGDMRGWWGGSQALQQQMETIRLLSWTNLQTLPGTFTATNNSGGVYSGQISQSAYDTYASNTTVMKITLTVTWTNQESRRVTNSLTTLVANGGLNKYISP